MKINIIRWIIRTKDRKYVVVGKAYTKHLRPVASLRKNVSPALYVNKKIAEEVLKRQTIYYNTNLPPYCYLGNDGTYKLNDFEVVKVTLEFEI